jgi:transcriptional regulator with XRE-family HTH domain
MSLQITISPKERAAGRFVERVRRAVQKALAEEHAKSGLTQSDIARAIGVNRSVVSREIRGHKDLTLSRVAEIAWALGRRPAFDMVPTAVAPGVNVPPLVAAAVNPLSAHSGSQQAGLPARPGLSPARSHLPDELKAILNNITVIGSAA